MSKKEVVALIIFHYLGHAVFIISLILFYNGSFGHFLVSQTQISVEFHPRIQTFDYFPWLVSVFGVVLISVTTKALSPELAAPRQTVKKNNSDDDGVHSHAKDGAFPSSESAKSLRRHLRIPYMITTITHIACAIILIFDPFNFGIKQYQSRSFWGGLLRTSMVITRGGCPPAMAVRTPDRYSLHIFVA